VKIGDAIDPVSARAPLIVLATLVLAVAGAQLDGPAWLSYALATAVMALAVLVWSRRGPSRQFKSKEQLGFSRYRDLLWFILFRSGPRGYAVLGFICLIGALLTGFRFPHLAPALAAMALTVAWAEDNTRYPAERPFRDT
jgi:hypothetical protein